MADKYDFRGFEKALCSLCTITPFGPARSSKSPALPPLTTAPTPAPWLAQGSDHSCQRTGKRIYRSRCCNDWKTVATVSKYPPLGVPEASGELLKKMEEWYPVESRRRAAAAWARESREGCIVPCQMSAVSRPRSFVLLPENRQRALSPEDNQVKVGQVPRQGGLVDRLILLSEVAPGIPG